MIVSYRSGINDIDDELHLLLKFPCFIPRYYYNRISIFKLIDLLKSENRNALIKLCKVIKLAFNHRNPLISRYSSTLNIFVHPLFCDVVIYVCMVDIYWVFIVSVYSVTLCVYVVWCVLFNDVQM